GPHGLPPDTGNHGDDSSPRPPGGRPTVCARRTLTHRGKRLAARRLSPPLPLHRGSAPRHDSLPGLLSPRHQRGARTRRQPRLLPIPPPPNRGLSCRRLQPTDQPLTAQLPSLAFHAFGVG